MNKLRVVLEIDVRDLSKDERIELQEYCGFEDELPNLKDYKKSGVAGAREVASVLNTTIVDDMMPELFAGADIYVKFDKIKVADAEWI